MKRFPVAFTIAVAVLLVALSGSVLAAAPTTNPAGSGQGQNGGQGQRRLQLELAWTAYGILELDKKPALRITPAQAAKLLGVMENVQKRLVEQSNRPQGAGNGGSGQGGAGSWQNISAADRERLRKALETRQGELQTALDQIDKILTTKQVEFLDNLDFDETPYTVRRPNGMTAPGGGGSGSQGSFNPQQMADFRKQAEAARVRLEKLFTQTVDYLKTRSKAKK